MESAKKTLIKNVSAIGLVQIANYLFPFITIPIISRIIGPDKFGVINFSAAFIAYFTLLIGFGFDLTATRKIAADPSNEQNRNIVFSEVFFSQCFLLLASMLIFVICLFHVPQLQQEKIVAIYTFITCFATVMTQSWLFQAMQDLPKIAILNLSSKVLFTIMVLTLIHTKQDYIWQPLSLSLSQLLIAIISFIWSIRRYHLRLQYVKLINCFKLLWNEKVFFFSLCLINLYTNTNIVVLGILQNPQQVGFYTSGQKLIAIIQSIIAIPLNQAFYPYIGKAFAENYHKGIDISKRLFSVIFLLTFLIGIIILICAPLFINLFYGNAYLPAIAICRILAFVPMCIALGSVCGVHIMMNLKMDRLFFRIISIGAIISLTLNIVFVKALGYIGSAWTWAITEFINLLILVFMLRKKDIHMNEYLKFDRQYFKTLFKLLKY